MQRSSRLSSFTGNRLELLAQRLASELGESPLPPEIRETVIVPSRGMGSWLGRELARHWGIAASLDLLFPDQFVDRVAERFDLGRPEPRDPFRPAAQLWELHDLFLQVQNGDRDDPDLGPLADHLRDDPDGRKRYQLARRVASLLAKYQFARPSQLAAWSVGEWFGEAPLEVAGERWQRALWRELTTRHAPLVPPAQRLLHLVRRIARGDFDDSWLPDRLSVFGASTLPPVIAQLLVALSAHRPVDLYFLVPTPGYLADLRSRRERERLVDPDPLDPAAELIGELGRVGRDFFATLLDLDPRGSAFTEAGFADPGTGSRLHHLQSALHAAGVEDVAPIGFAADDRSLQLHCCHSPLREMEVLRDEVLRALADGAAPSVEDVLLLVPDISVYAPFARSAFGAAIEHGDGWLRLPLMVADRAGASDQPFARIVLRWLELAGARLTLSEVFEVLHERVVRARFGFAEEELEAMRDRLSEAGVVWGVDPAARALRSGSVPFEGVSWREGLDRMLLGCFMGSSRELVDGVLPAADATVSETELLGELGLALDLLFGMVTKLEGPHPVEDWMEQLRQGVLRLTEASDERDATRRAQCLELLDRIADDSNGSRAPVGRLAMLDLLRREFGALEGGSGFVTGMLTVAELRPMRSLPAAVIAVAGLDADSFPRPDPRDGLDLVARDPRPGDRSLRDDDRQLFLELLLCARERLILSYVGRSQRDDHERTLSPCVEELLDTLDRLGSGRIEIRHSLQPFASTAGPEESFDHGLVRAAQRLSAPVPVPALVDGSVEVEPVEEIDLADLREFWRSPAAWYCRRTLQLALARDRETAEAETLRLDGLLRWKARDLMLREGIAALAAPGLVARLGLPALDVVDIEFAELRADARQMEAEHGFVLGQTVSEPVVAIGDGYAVRGALERAADGRLIELGASSRFEPKSQVAALVAHVVAGASGIVQPTVAGTLGDPGRIDNWTPLPDPSGVLALLVEGFRRGQSVPLRFFPRTSLAFAKAYEGNARAAFDAPTVQKAWAQLPEDAYVTSATGERFEESVALCFRGIEDVCDEEFVQWSLRVARWLDIARGEA